MALIDKVAGSLFGLAFGDAYGAPTEFLSFDEILRRWPTGEPPDLQGDPVPVTDDTQMTIAVTEALLEGRAHGNFTARNLEPPLRRAFVRWLNDPDNDRAPGRTCLTACEGLEAGKPWTEATVQSSKGCGANMRVAPVGLLPAGSAGLTEETRAAMAQFQAALTHGHPTALAASDLTARAINDLLAGGELKTLPQRLRAYAESQQLIYHARWLGSLWERPGVMSPESFIWRGWEECLAVLDRLDAALINPDREADPCLATGGGWVAEEALATGLLCFLMFPDDPRKALWRAAVTSGDSDSIACLTGAFIGAYHGIAAWPRDWIERIEYKDKLSRLAAELIA
ncbi:MAG TPA: ADP-ribosylglycohydrolase family protein [Pyrinomonadaceae bacterium]|nr:ADP-ribosylglycohydrolase family protein [Pyrinomonadaceae bacterium]